MKIIEESTKTMLAMWAKPPPEDDLKRREILQSNLQYVTSPLTLYCVYSDPLLI